MQLVLKIIVWITQKGFLILLFSIPWILRSLNYALMLILTAMGSLWFGVPYTVNLMAQEWVTRAIIVGLPPAWERQLYNGLSVIALLTIIAGWIIVIFTAIFIWRYSF